MGWACSGTNQFAPDGTRSNSSLRVDQLLGTVVQRSRHFAQRVYPPNDLRPTADFGPFPIGVRTLMLSDASRMNVPGKPSGNWGWRFDWSQVDAGSSARSRARAERSGRLVPRALSG